MHGNNLKQKKDTTMQNLQSIASQNEGMLDIRYDINLNRWKAQIKHVSNGSILLEILGESRLEVSNSYAKWLYSPMKTQELSIDASDTDTISYENDADLDLIQLVERM
jgi:hypothetical protein